MLIVPKNIYCIGRNYAEHANELGNDIPDQPLLFSKPTHAYVETSNQIINLPTNQGEIHYEIEMVLHVQQKVKKGDLVEDVVSHMALGLDLTLRDVQTELKKKGHPWLRAKGFKNSAIVTPFWIFEGNDDCYNHDFSFVINDKIVQVGNIKNMLFPFQTIVDECQESFGLGSGDLIFTGTPQGVGPLRSGDCCQLYWGNELKGSFIVA
ncbi:fumarylacetoacetate hydrolase family protein [Bacillus suaedae]|uniref:Fumarylacetoacetate hydrolase family protein n=1 Tax=Halalkalibacter suaedae TaxID=2822140 RepID=A0A941ATD9_9BACI|nr:fumarylacetoacetate hydrolase family protein [Bacillus suaedae]MBP3951494.1 fumarylacetoacetate hydrolase family protein [Bacillus suaedae]